VPPDARGNTLAAFHMQLLQRLRNEARNTGVPVQRLQQRIAFERLLARLPQNGEWVLKGGGGLLFRYGLQTRTTKDVDLRTELTLSKALESLLATVSSTSVDDHFSFELGPAVDELQGAPGGSLRVKVITRVAGIEFTHFHLDVSSGDVLVGSPDKLQGSSLLEFAGIPPVEFPVYPVTQQIAEKLHAYTLPRSQENTRVKDLADLVKFAASEKVDAQMLHESIEATFKTRDTHDIPGQLQHPPFPGRSPTHQRLGRYRGYPSEIWKVPLP
jgi:predicted nucleotidyltransferase component of viral defense system